MKKWFEKWLAEKARRKEKNLPAVVDYRDVTYVSLSVAECVSQVQADVYSGDSTLHYAARVCM